MTEPDRSPADSGADDPIEAPAPAVDAPLEVDPADAAEQRRDAVSEDDLLDDTPDRY